MNATFTPELELKLPNRFEAAASARKSLTKLVKSVPGPVLDDVALLVSELVTNSMRHAGTPSSAKILLSVSMNRKTIRVKVHDEGSGFKPITRPLRPSQSSGWGLKLVDAIADRWGVDLSSGTTVWFEVDTIRT